MLEIKTTSRKVTKRWSAKFNLSRRLSTTLTTSTKTTSLPATGIQLWEEHQPWPMDSSALLSLTPRTTEQPVATFMPITSALCITFRLVCYSDWQLDSSDLETVKPSTTHTRLSVCADDIQTPCRSQHMPATCGCSRTSRPLTISTGGNELGATRPYLLFIYLLYYYLN